VRGRVFRGQSAGSEGVSQRQKRPKHESRADGSIAVSLRTPTPHAF
jgi:hypothetical protein